MAGHIYILYYIYIPFSEGPHGDVHALPRAPVILLFFNPALPRPSIWNRREQLDRLNSTTIPSSTKQRRSAATHPH